MKWFEGILMSYTSAAPQGGNSFYRLIGYEEINLLNNFNFALLVFPGELNRFYAVETMIGILNLLQ